MCLRHAPGLKSGAHVHTKTKMAGTGNRVLSPFSNGEDEVQQPLMMEKIKPETTAIDRRASAPRVAITGQSNHIFPASFGQFKNVIGDLPVFESNGVNCEAFNIF